MAYMSQEMKKELAPAIKAVLKKYNVKGTIAVRHHSTLVVNIKSGALDLVGAANKHAQIENDKRGYVWNCTETDYFELNHYHFSKWMREIGEKKIANFADELIAAMRGDKWYDNSDSQIDYFETAYYLDINVGNWEKPYVFG